MGARSVPDEPSPFLTEAIEVLGAQVEIPEPADEGEEDRIETTLWPVPRTEQVAAAQRAAEWVEDSRAVGLRSEEHTSELQSRFDLVCRLLLEKKTNDSIYKLKMI